MEGTIDFIAYVYPDFHNMVLSNMEEWRHRDGSKVKPKIGKTYKVQFKKDINHVLNPNTGLWIIQRNLDKKRLWMTQDNYVKSKELIEWIKSEAIVELYLSENSGLVGKIHHQKIEPVKIKKETPIVTISNLPKQKKIERIDFIADVYTDFVEMVATESSKWKPQGNFGDNPEDGNRYFVQFEKNIEGDFNPNTGFWIANSNWDKKRLWINEQENQFVLSSQMIMWIALKAIIEIGYNNNTWNIYSIAIGDNIVPPIDPKKIYLLNTGTIPMINEYIPLNDMDLVTKKFVLDNVVEGPQGEPGKPGKKGDQGIKGLAGDQGIKGAAGEQGIQGPKGDQGIKGNDGTIGQDGAEGPQGATGSTGADGAKGDKGDPGIQGPIGVDGIPGREGDQGIQGTIGPKGDKGDKAYISGSNANGYYCKFDDGFMIQTCIEKQIGPSNIPTGNVFAGTQTTITYPVSFVDLHIALSLGSNNAATILSVDTNNSTDYCLIGGWSVLSQNTGRVVEVIALGRWK